MTYIHKMLNLGFLLFCDELLLPLLEPKKLFFIYFTQLLGMRGGAVPVVQSLLAAVS